ncbi:unnamed protein product, partial [marine sediment metagenome]
HHFVAYTNFGVMELKETADSSTMNLLSENCFLGDPKNWP